MVWIWTISDLCNGLEVPKSMKTHDILFYQIICHLTWADVYAQCTNFNKLEIRYGCWIISTVSYSCNRHFRQMNACLVFLKYLFYLKWTFTAVEHLPGKASILQGIYMYMYMYHIIRHKVKVMPSVESQKGLSLCWSIWVTALLAPNGWYMKNG